jgi:hypothetical protein
VSLIQARRDPGPRELRLFAIALPIALGVFGAWAAHGFGSLVWGVPFWLAAGLAAIAGALSPVARMWLYRTWTTVMAPVGHVLSWILLAVVYFGVVTPVGFILRLVRGDFLGRRLDPAASTHWSKPARHDDPERYFHQS